VEDVALEELRRRLGDDALLVLDVRSPREYEGLAGASCDPRQGHIPGAVNLPLDAFLQCRTAAELRALVGAPDGTEIVAYCHSGSRSAFAAQLLREVGYDARNYVGSWHEWSRAVPAD
jgi:thiosulfate/3-mercaptopyruvate sulfurtransferase